MQVALPGGAWRNGQLVKEEDKLEHYCDVVHE